jgi:hypothetical protein
VRNTRTQAVYELARRIDERASHTTALGSASEAERLYRQRYHAAQRIYFKEAKPLRFADVIFVNEDLEAPVFFIRPEATEPVALKRT